MNHKTIRSIVAEQQTSSREDPLAGVRIFGFHIEIALGDESGASDCGIVDGAIVLACYSLVLQLH